MIRAEGSKTNVVIVCEGEMLIYVEIQLIIQHIYAVNLNMYLTHDLNVLQIFRFKVIIFKLKGLGSYRLKHQ